MENVEILLIMLFLHIVADFNLQGILAEMKQIKFWEKEAEKLGMSKEEYKNSIYVKDYIMALVTHSYAWTFLFMLPILSTFGCSFKYLLFFIINLIFHSCIDDLKANKFKINLVEDQVWHLIQIVATWVVFIV